MVDFFDFGLVAIVVCGEIVGDALLQRTVGNCVETDSNVSYGVKNLFYKSGAISEVIKHFSAQLY